MPKSVSFAAAPPSAEASGQMTFDGLTSRCTTPRAWAWARASHSVAPMRSDVAVRQRAVALELRERPAADELGDEHPAVVVAAGLVQRDDRRVPQPCGGERLARGALAGLVARALGVHRDALDRHVAVEVLVVGLVDDAHAAACRVAGRSR